MELNINYRDIVEKAVEKSKEELDKKKDDKVVNGKDGKPVDKGADDEVKKGEKE